MGKSLAGMYAALLTGFSDDGAFDAHRQVAIAEYVLGQGLDGIYIGGSSGESGLMSTDELLEQQVVIANMETAKASRVIAHVGQPSLRDSVALARQAEKLGFGALSALPPHSYPFSDEEIYGYYSDVAAATSLPLIVYEIPLRTSRPFSMELLQRLLDLPSVAGLKFTSTDLFKLAVLRRSRPEKAFFYGFDEIFAGAATLGCDGGIGTTYNLLGRLYVALNQCFARSSLVEAQELQNISQRLVDVLFEIGVIPGMKSALRCMGIDAGYARAPFREKVDDADRRIARFLEQEDVKRWLS